MRSRIFICIVFVFAFFPASANSAKAQGGNATVGSSPVIKKPVSPPKKTATVKSRSNSSSKTNTAKQTSPKPKTNVQPKSAKTATKIGITVRDNSSSPVGGAGLGGESIKACSYYIGSGLYEKWEQMGGENGKLGCPIMNESEASRSPQETTGRFTEFRKNDGGYIIWHGSGPYRGTTFAVDGCFFILYKQVGGTSSYLGFPVGDAYASNGGSRQDFEGGYMLWDSKTSICTAYENQ